MGIAFHKLKNHQENPGKRENSVEGKEYETKLEFLYDVAQRASSATEVYELLKEIPAVIQRILGAAASSLFMVDEEKKILCLQAAGHDKSGMLKHIRLSLNSGVVGWVAKNGTPVVINDVSQDKRFSREVDEATGFVTRSILAAPLMRKKKVIGVVEMINKEDGSPFTDKDLGLITEFASTEALVLLVSMAATLINNFKLCQTIQDEYRSTIETLVTAADAKDPYAHGHSRRVREYTMLGADYLQLPPGELKLIEFGALLHDIGKIGIDDRILRKSGPLSAEESYIIRKHALKGANIVGAIPNLAGAADLILYHHERYDGSGYPEGLKGDQIPLGARLIGVADAFDTMTTDRAYRDASSVDEAINELIECSGLQFCPMAVKAFVAGFQKNRNTLEICQQQVAAGGEEKDIEENVKPGDDREVREKETRLAAKERVRCEAEEAKKDREARKLAEKAAKQAARDRARREAEGARKDKEARKLAEKEARQTARERTKQEAGDSKKEKHKRQELADISSRLFEGPVQLGITQIDSFRQINQFRKSLLATDNLNVVSDSWSEEEGFIITISVKKPIALGKVLKKMPNVAEVYSEGDKIVVALRASGEIE